MINDENTFFRQATLRICGNLDFEIALQECLVYLKSFMPADIIHLNLYDHLFLLGMFRLLSALHSSQHECSRLASVVP